MYKSFNAVGEIDWTLFYIIGISLFFLVLITALMIYFVIRYRRSIHPEPTDIRGNWFLEIAWTVVPTAIALSMFYYGWTSYIGTRNVPPGAMEIDVTAQQYSYLFTYPNGKVSEGELVVPQGKAVKLNMQSVDVLHGFFIPALRIKRDILPNMKTYVWFQEESTGEYDILCTQYCGTRHSEMRATLKVVPLDEYEKWLATEEEGK
jgi:cytochrome c oxidase subunit II